MSRSAKPVLTDTPGLPAEVEPGFSSYAAALRHLNERVNFERATRIVPGDFKLDRMAAILEQLGNPQKAVPCVHVAGSKGKGSIVEMTAACLQACGFTTGIYTSPHLVDVRERIRINADPIPASAFTLAVGRVAAAAAVVEPRLGEATYFELLTAMMFDYFAQSAVDIAVIEVGIGGRLDATNLCAPLATAVAAIQLEHTQVLGHTLEAIAREKAGIFKTGVPAVTIAQTPGVARTLREAAAAAGAPIEVLGEEIDFTYRVESSPELGPHARVCVTTPRSNFEHLPVPLRGEHQALNCGLALALVDKLRERGFDTPERHVADGLNRTPTNGRLELVATSPRVIIDGAHTPDSIRCLMKTLAAHLRYDSLVVVFGCAADKDVRGMLSRLATGADKIIFTRASQNARATDQRELQRTFAEVSGKMTQTAKNVPDALSIANRAVGRGDLILVTGSYYVAGEAKRHILDRAKRG